MQGLEAKAQPKLRITRAAVATYIAIPGLLLEDVAPELKCWQEALHR